MSKPESQITYPFELEEECLDFLHHVAHWDIVFTLAAKAPLQKDHLGRPMTIYSSTLSVLRGVYCGTLDFPMISEKSAKMIELEAARITKLMPFTTRLNVITEYIQPDLKPLPKSKLARAIANEDEEISKPAKESAKVFQGQLETIMRNAHLTAEDVEFYLDNADVLGNLSQILSLTKLTVTQFIKKRKLLTDVENVPRQLKVLKFDKCEVVFAAPNPRRGGQIMHATDPKLVAENPLDGTWADRDEPHLVATSPIAQPPGSEARERAAQRDRDDKAEAEATYASSGVNENLRALTMNERTPAKE